jgi:signal transduction histidine kinase
VTDEVMAMLGPIRERAGSLDPLPVEPLDVNGIVQRAVAIAHARWDQQGVASPPAIEYQVETSGSPLLAYASASLVGAIVHAIENAVEAMPEGGRVRLRTARDNGHVSITVEDSGDGAAKELPPDAFAPLVSTKERPHLGLGLPVIRSLVSRHGGSVSLTRGGGGTVLEIRLPAVKASAQ